MRRIKTRAPSRRTSTRDPAARRRSRERAKVLLLEDAWGNFRLFEAALRDMGLKVVRVKSGGQALLEAARQYFAVILLDRRMPGNALRTAEALRRHERTRETPILFTSATEKTPLQAGGILNGDLDYVFSPVNLGTLKRKVKRYVDRFRAGARAKVEHAGLAKRFSARGRRIRRLEGTVRDLHRGVDSRFAQSKEPEEDPW